MPVTELRVPLGTSSWGWRVGAAGQPGASRPPCLPCPPSPGLSSLGWHRLGDPKLPSSSTSSVSEFSDLSRLKEVVST